MNYISKKFNIHYLPEYTLLVKAGFRKDILAVVDGKQVAPVLIEYASEDPTVDATQLLSLPFRFVRLVLPQQAFTFIPNEVFNEQRMADYVAFLDPDNLKDTFTYHLTNIGAVAVCQYDKLLYARWKKLYPDAVLVPEFVVVLEQAQDRIPIRGSFLGIHVLDEHHVDFYLFNNGQFLLYNTFEVENGDDLSFFILNMLTQFNLGDFFNKILLSGEIPDEAFYRQAASYATDLEVLSAKTKITLADRETGDSLDRYGVLFDAILCG